MGKRALSKTTNGDFDVELPCTSIVIIKVYPWVLKVEEYFESLGFSCPPQRDIADYLLDLGSKQQHLDEVFVPTKQLRSTNELV
ncbi:hypothetical protein L915_15913, partial [Phytophthora nicotianae]